MQQSLFRKIFLENITRKLLALITAAIVWYIVSHSITTTKVFSHVSVRIINLPPDMTVRGLMPTGVWDRKLTLTLTGTKDILERLGPHDFEVLIDASGEGNEWIVELGKKNLVSLNPDIDLMHAITSVEHEEFIITLSRLVTEKVPVYILAPKGEAPQGYQFLDVWPKKLMHTISGSEPDIKELQEKGLELSFDLSDITQEDLDALSAKDGATGQVSFLVPDGWKKVAIPFLDNIKQQINSPEAKLLRMDFVRNELFSLESKISLLPFYPLTNVEEINPHTTPIVTNNFVVNKNGVLVINKPIFVKNVSHQFLDAVKDNLAIVVLVSGEMGDKSGLKWALQFIDPLDLEERYVATLLTGAGTFPLDFHMMQQEKYLRERFQKYMQTMELFFEEGHPFALDARLEKEKVVILER